MSNSRAQETILHAPPLIPAIVSVLREAHGSKTICLNCTPALNDLFENEKLRTDIKEEF